MPLQQVPRVHFQRGRQGPGRRLEKKTQTQRVQKTTETQSTTKKMYIPPNNSEQALKDLSTIIEDIYLLKTDYETEREKIE